MEGQAGDRIMVMGRGQVVLGTGVMECLVPMEGNSTETIMGHRDREIMGLHKAKIIMDHSKDTELGGIMARGHSKAAITGGHNKAITRGHKAPERALRNYAK